MGGVKVAVVYVQSGKEHITLDMPYFRSVLRSRVQDLGRRVYLMTYARWASDTHGGQERRSSGVRDELTENNESWPGIRIGVEERLRVHR